MKYRTTELEIIKQLFNSLSETDKKSFIKSIKSKDKNSFSKYSKVSKTISQKEINFCPHCKTEKIVKNGKKNGNQRYLCRECKRTFAPTNNTILFNSKKDIEVWQKYIQCMIEKNSLHKTAKICNISVATAFTWRHKILDALQNMMNEVELDGIVEADETFLSLSFKGNHKNF